jgi:hypothetical protein
MNIEILFLGSLFLTTLLARVAVREQMRLATAAEYAHGRLATSPPAKSLLSPFSLLKQLRNAGR